MSRLTSEVVEQEIVELRNILDQSRRHVGFVSETRQTGELSLIPIQHVENFPGSSPWGQLTL